MIPTSLYTNYKTNLKKSKDTFLIKEMKKCRKPYGASHF